MNPFQLRKHVRKVTKKVLSNYHGGLLVIEAVPASKFEAFKEKHFPKWLVSRFPVKYMEKH